MFFRIALPGARRILGDHIDFCNRHVPKWNPMSVVGQHTQQAGATPAESMAFTLSAALQNAQDCIDRGMDPDAFLPRFTFFFDISISFFEEIAKFRAGRRIWARAHRERLGAKDPRSWRFKFHGQTSGVDLTRQQPLNNIARVAVQAMAGIFGGLQSLHTDAFDEALSTPTEFGARIAVNTQNILREEAHLTDVIDPLGGSFYLERLTDRMEAEILRTMQLVEDAGGMYKAVESGLVQKMIGESARRFQQKVESGEQTVVGVNAYQAAEDKSARQPLARPDAAAMRAPRWSSSGLSRRARSAQAVAGALDALARSAHDPKLNLFGAVVEAAEAGCTHARSAPRCGANSASGTCRRSSERRRGHIRSAPRPDERHRPPAAGTAAGRRAARRRAGNQHDRERGAGLGVDRRRRGGRARPRARHRHHRRAGCRQVDADQRAAR